MPLKNRWVNKNIDQALWFTNHFNEPLSTLCVPTKFFQEEKWRETDIHIKIIFYLMVIAFFKICKHKH